MGGGAIVDFSSDCRIRWWKVYNRSLSSLYL